MTSKNARGYQRNPTDRSIDPHDGEDSDVSAESSTTRASKGCAGQGARTEASAGEDQEVVYDSTDELLPDSWDAVAVDKPNHLNNHVSPRDLQVAAADADSVFEVTQQVRAARKDVKTALNALEIPVPMADSYGQALTNGGDA